VVERTAHRLEQKVGHHVIQDEAFAKPTGRRPFAIQMVEISMEQMKTRRFSLQG